ncbi:Phosphoglycerate kinase-like protein, related [Eimeria tenella]|uniref:Phosphoglycerate kinase n=1 Tax=Eimeria tenella TaxID=5802 RepID=U6L816_EIMTE|nr:Phosphoglycerate kinase-like protein, related [Eimeria tenella]CDJ44714.1 Phosphoglycerate kinase-like protein, related [Eimeria tenella]|eukprot:XP_013235462.1 Phosphoglycerate kinase-like protein, related [Eimeria tenella]
MALDHGPLTNQRFAAAIRDSKTIVWNGPMGYAENPAFREGTAAVAEAAAAATAAGAVSIVGGGDSLAAVKLLQQQNANLQLTHLSTGGGATLKLLEGAPMPALQALTSRQQLEQLIH